MDSLSLFTVTLVLFLIMDPLGNVGSYLKLVQGIDPKRQKRIVFREMTIALAVMVAFNFLGEAIFSALQISEMSIRLASGIILFLIAIRILFPSKNSLRAHLPEGEPFITPLAIPLIAGPSLLATIMLYTHSEPSPFLMLIAIFLAWSLASLVLLFSSFFKRILGTNGLIAAERLMGMVLVLLAVQRFLEGLRQFVDACKH